MPRKAKVFVPKVPADILKTVKAEIVNRDSSHRRWRCLEEQVMSEDRRRSEFNDRYLKKANIVQLPNTIQKFIRTLSALLDKCLFTGIQTRREH